MSQIATYLIVDAVFTPEQVWLDRIAAKCNIDVSVDKQILNYKSVVQSGASLFLYGAYLGLLLQTRTRWSIEKLKTCDTSELQINRLNIPKFAGRVVVAVLLILAPGLCILLIPWTCSLATLIIFKMLLPAILAGFALFAFSDYFWLKFNLAETVVRREEAIEFEGVHSSGEK